uniref:Uncharacterized protein n=1 Tax=Arundo donax TaxID=35708 RepID=A0A0A9E547_ARUDO
MYSHKIVVLLRYNQAW